MALKLLNLNTTNLKLRTTMNEGDTDSSSIEFNSQLY